ncbi:MAG TPA: hypothetical protein VE219_04215 [Candidatus Sulfotelmatobacter sp.]|nr:hypothetical protein [Candidatus Sulfotelmatobacter sp.]
MLLDRYDPPGFLTDLDAVPGLRERWSAAVSGWIDDCIALQTQGAGGAPPPLAGQPCQFYNAQTTEVAEPIFEQAVVWNALPGTLRNLYGRKQALEMAEQPVPLLRRPSGTAPGDDPPAATLLYRQQDEYCEWRTERHPASGKITKVTFTSEPPEYWNALQGETLPDIHGQPAYPMSGNPKLVVDLYRRYVNPAVNAEDLVFAEDVTNSAGQVVFPKGAYNPWNRWNTTDGIMHLTHPSNSLMAEIQLAADATVLRSSDPKGKSIADPEALICCTFFGIPDRISDPTIGSTVNQLAAQGFRLTLRNPVGIYMHHLDLAGFAKPDGSPVGAEYFQVLRGDAERHMIERAEFRVPEGEGFTVGDLTIAGVPITLGSQLAEHMTITLVALAAEPGSIRNKPAGCRLRCCQELDAPQVLIPRLPTRPCPPGTSAAFDSPDVTPADARRTPAPGVFLTPSHRAAFAALPGVLD